MIKKLFGLIIILIFSIFSLLNGPTISSKFLVNEIFNYQLDNTTKESSLLEKTLLNIGMVFSEDISKTKKLILNDINENIEYDSKNEIRLKTKKLFKKYYDDKSKPTLNILANGIYNIEKKPDIFSGLRNGLYIVSAPIGSTFLELTGFVSYVFYDRLPNIAINYLNGSTDVENENSQEIRQNIKNLTIREKLFEMIKIPFLNIWMSLKMWSSLFFMKGTIFYHIAYILSLICSFIIIVIPLVPLRKLKEQPETENENKH